MKQLLLILLSFLGSIAVNAQVYVVQLSTGLEIIFQDECEADAYIVEYARNAIKIELSENAIDYLCNGCCTEDGITEPISDVKEPTKLEVLAEYENAKYLSLIELQNQYCKKSCKRNNVGLWHIAKHIESLGFDMPLSADMDTLAESIYCYFNDEDCTNGITQCDGNDL